MKFDVVEPSEEQAIAADEAGAASGAPEEELPRVHPKLAQASRSMRTRLRDDLAALNASLGRLDEHVRTARHRETDGTPAGPPPTNFRAGAFSLPGAPAPRPRP